MRVQCSSYMVYRLTALLLLAAAVLSLFTCAFSTILVRSEIGAADSSHRIRSLAAQAVSDILIAPKKSIEQSSETLRSGLKDRVYSMAEMLAWLLHAEQPALYTRTHCVRYISHFYAAPCLGTSLGGHAPPSSFS